MPSRSPPIQLPKRRGRARVGEPRSQRPLEVGNRVPEALLEEPQSLPDLVDDPRALGADLVRLPEKRDLLREPVLDPPALRERGGLVVEAGEERGHPAMRVEDGTTRSLGGMRSEDELHPQPRARRLQRRGVDATAVEVPERIGERLARDPALGLVLASPADPVVLLGDVDELEEERERPQHGRLALESERGDRDAERLARPAGAGVARKRADPLLVVEQVPPALLDQHAPEQISEQANIGAQCRVGRHGPSLEKARAHPGVRGMHRHHPSCR